jgi:gamma-glutamyltranspeptidase/glutathione hydrolase
MRAGEDMKCLRSFIVVICSIVCLQQSFVADLSPGKWNPAEKTKIEQLEMSPFAPEARTVEGRSALISNTSSPIAVHAGIEALKQGGNAADAAATVALTHITTALGSYISYAGIAQILYYEAKSGKIYSIGAGWNSYRGEDDPKSIPSADLAFLNGQKAAGGAEGRKTLVPGFMAGMEAMHKRFGRLPFSQLFQPAVWYAEHGVAISPLLSSYFEMQGKFLSRTGEGREFINQSGSASRKIGDRFVQLELAKTLRQVAQKGSAYMYSGDWGTKFVEAVKREGGKATLEDMKNYQPLWEEPLSTTFAGNSIFVPGKSNEAGHQVLEALNLAEELKLDRAGLYWKDASVFSVLTRILQFVAIGPHLTPEVVEYQNRNKLTFSSDERITKAYARAMAPMIQGGQTEGTVPQNPRHTAAVVVIDRWGNVAAIVHSINSGPWGSTGIVVGGIPISDAAGFQQLRLAAVKPGNRIPDDMAPTIVLRETKPILATVSVGSSEVFETTRILLGMLGNETDCLSILAAPPLLYNFEAPQAGETYTWKRQLIPEGAYNLQFRKDLEAFGVKVEQVPKARLWSIKGTTAFGAIDVKSSVRKSAEYPEVTDFVEAY